VRLDPGAADAIIQISLDVDQFLDRCEDSRSILAPGVDSIEIEPAAQMGWMPFDAECACRSHPICQHVYYYTGHIICSDSHTRSFGDLTSGMPQGIVRGIAKALLTKTISFFHNYNAKKGQKVRFTLLRRPSGLFQQFHLSKICFAAGIEFVKINTARQVVGIECDAVVSGPLPAIDERSDLFSK
jgi:hypothetical protein